MGNRAEPKTADFARCAASRKNDGRQPVVEGKIIPVEVESGDTGRLRSLHLFMDTAPHAMAVRLYAGR